MNLVLVDGDKYKDMIAARMKKENGRGSWMVHASCDMEYAEQVTAEHKVNEKSGTKSIQRWRLKRAHADNHYLDTEVYALAAADIMGVRSMHLSEAPEEAPKPVVEKTQESPEESWIKTNEQWI